MIMKNESLSFGTANGETTAYVALPETDRKRAAIVVQEWRGLNDHITAIASRYADEGVIAIAPDLYRVRVATNADEASNLMHELNTEDGLDTINNAIARASETYGLSHFGITGFCMGGTFA